MLVSGTAFSAHTADTNTAEGSSNNNIEQLFERFETKTSLHQLICQLPEKYCNVLLLRDIQGLSTKETSVYLNISESLVQAILKSTKGCLRNKLTS
jgi:RNA polymerase sigma-70 factor (ECF subfamily)